VIAEKGKRRRKDHRRGSSPFFVFFSFFRLTERTDKRFFSDGRNRQKETKEEWQKNGWQKDGWQKNGVGERWWWSVRRVGQSNRGRERARPRVVQSEHCRWTAFFAASPAVACSPARGYPNCVPVPIFGRRMRQGGAGRYRMIAVRLPGSSVNLACSSGVRALLVDQIADRFQIQWRLAFGACKTK